MDSEKDCVRSSVAAGRSLSNMGQIQITPSAACAWYLYCRKACCTSVCTREYLFVAKPVVSRQLASKMNCPCPSAFALNGPH